jgi:hypothetical protein
MKNTLWFWLALCFFTFNKTTVFATEIPAALKPQQSTMGKIEAITDNEITLMTDDGKMRKFTVNRAQREEIKRKDLKQGDRIGLMFNQQNQITEINKVKPSPGPGLTPAPVPSP